MLSAMASRCKKRASEYILMFFKLNLWNLASIV